MWGSAGCGGARGVGGCGQLAHAGLVTLTRASSLQGRPLCLPDPSTLSHLPLPFWAPVLPQTLQSVYWGWGPTLPQTPGWSQKDAFRYAA